MFPKAAEYAAKPLREKAKDFVGTRNMLMQVTCPRSRRSFLFPPILIPTSSAAPPQTFLDMCVYHPFIYFPSFYMLKSYMSGGTLEEGREMYAQNYKDDLPVTPPATHGRLSCFCVREGDVGGVRGGV